MPAFRDAARRLFDTWRDSWRHRHALDGPALLAHEIEFLPAAQALRDAAPHPAPRVLLGLVLLLGTLTLAWATLGRVDIVAVADGKVLAAGRSKPVQADATAVVKAIHVDDGQAVAAGQLLVEFDPSAAEAELHRRQSEWFAARLDQARAGALLTALDDRRPPHPPAPRDVPAEQLPAWRARVRAQYLETAAALAQDAALVRERDAEIAATRAGIESLRQSLPINRDMAADYRRLLEGRYVSRHDWLQRERLVLEQTQQLSAMRARLAQAEANRTQAVRQRERAQAEARHALLDLQQEAGQRLDTLARDLRAARQRDALTRLVAPVAGIVQQLAVTAPGAVVTTAQPIMLIVPDGAPVEVEAFLASRDAGFVQAGQAVRLKVDAFDFTRHGLLAGEVASVSPEAIADPQRGPVYAVRIRLLDAEHGGNRLAVTPGMGVRAEIRTGQRRILEFLLSPLQRRLDESLHER